MEIERQIAAVESRFARVDVGFLQLGEGVGVELLAERALVVGELDDRQRRVLRAQQRRIAHRDLGLRELLALRRRVLRLLLLQQLADLAQLGQNVVRLLARNAFGRRLRILRAQRQQ